MAPELLAGNGYNCQVDFWSLGVMMFEAVFNKLPFGALERDVYQVYKATLKHELILPTDPPVNEQVLQILTLLLSTDPSQRKGCRVEVFMHHP